MRRLSLWRPRSLLAFLAWTIHLVVSHVRAYLAKRVACADDDEQRRQRHGKCVVVTGASVGGLGFAIASRLAFTADVVIVTAPNETDALQAVAHMRKTVPKHVQVKPYLLDLAKIEGIISFACAVTRDYRVTSLVNNAASCCTEAGDEADIYVRRVNELGPLLLTALVRAQRVLWITSFTHRAAEVQKQGVTYTCAARRYADSKRRALMCALALRARDDGAVHVCHDPGAVDTRLTSEWPTALRMAHRIALRNLGLLVSADSAALGAGRADGAYTFGTSAKPLPVNLQNAEVGASESAAEVIRWTTTYCGGAEVVREACNWLHKNMLINK